MIGSILGRIPGLPTKRSLGRRFIRRCYEYYLGDADVLGHVKGPDGVWHLVPADYAEELPPEWRGEIPRAERERVDEWYIPTDGSRPYPADGVGGAPGTLFGIPIAVGYRQFGEARRVPNTEIARNVYLLGGERRRDEVEPSAEGSGFDRLTDGVRDRFRWLLDADARADWFGEFGYKLYRGTKLLGKGYTADALQYAQDPDGRWALERLQFNADMGVYESLATGKPADPSGLGAEPAEIFGQFVGYGNSDEPTLKAAITPRLGRNLHEEELATAENGYANGGPTVDTVGGQVYDQSGQPVATDGGVELETEPKEATYRHDDIMLEERAFVLPEDTRLLGGNQELSEQIVTMVERAKVSQNMPGDGMMDAAFRYGGIFMGLILGWWFGQQSGGGGGGGGVSGAVTGVMPGYVGVPDVTMAGVDAVLAAMVHLPGVVA